MFLEGDRVMVDPKYINDNDDLAFFTWLYRQNNERCYFVRNMPASYSGFIEVKLYDSNKMVHKFVLRRCYCYEVIDNCLPLVNRKQLFLERYIKKNRKYNNGI